MNTLKNFLIVMALGVWILGGLVNPALGQAECTAWGNLTGIRVDGQLMEFETGLRVVAPDWSGFIQTAKERQLPRFSRDGNKQTISSRLENLSLVEVVEDTGPAVIRFQNGALGNIVVSNSQKPGIFGKVHMHGQNGASVGVQTDGGAMFIAGMSEIAEPPINDLWTVPGEEELLPGWQE